MTCCFHGNPPTHMQLVTLKESLLEEVKSQQAVLDFDHLKVGGWGTGTDTPTPVRIADCITACTLEVYRTWSATYVFIIIVCGLRCDANWAQ